MAPRPYWKGYLKLSLVSCAVALYPTASKSERIAFHWLNRETGNRLKQQMVDSGTEELVDREDRVRGYEISKNEHLTIEESELDAVEIESSHTIDIETFIPRDEIDSIFLDNSHYLAPNDKVAEEAFSVIREAMASEGVVGIGRAVMARRERLLVLEPRGKGILATVLHYNYEVRKDDAYFDEIPDIKISKEMLELAKHIIHTKSGHFDPSAFEDRYENALIELVRAKQAGRPLDLPTQQKPRNVVNLLDALRSSIAAEKSGTADASRTRDTVQAGEKSRGRPSATEDADRPRARTAKPSSTPAKTRTAAASRAEATRTAAAEPAEMAKPLRTRKARP